MSRLVDERIVEMSFDNRDFEKHTKESMQTIDELKEKMDFSGVAESMNDSFDSVDTSVLAKGLEKVSDGFSTLEIAAISAISNITNRLINLGTNLVKSLSIDNITAGWQKYADTTVSVGTLISQGFDMETVTDQLEKLQFFTDETSYTFTDMVSNIGKFTAAGQDLDTSVEAMMGIANWAALSGQNATTASRAMYQLSQAMGAGVVRLQDYRSIQSANMDTVEFRQKVLDTAKDIGILTESIDGMYQTSSGKRFNIDQFTEYLSEGWFTSDVLVKSLNKYSSAVDSIYERVQETGETASEAIENLSSQLDEFGLKAFKASQEARTFEDVLNSVKEAAASGFSNIFQSFFGDYEQAKVLWTDLANELYDLFIEPINLISDAFKIWKDEGRDLLFANTEEASGAFWDIYYAISSIVNLFRESFLKVFNIEATDKLADKLLEITKSIKSFTSQLVITEELSEKLSNIFGGFASIVKTVFSGISGLLKSLKPALQFVFNIGKKLINILSDIGKEVSIFLNNFTLFKDIQNFISDFLTDIFDLFTKLNILDDIRNAIKRFFNIFKDSGGTLNNVKRIINDIFLLINTVKSAVMTVVDVIVNSIYPVIKPLLDIVFDAVPIVLGTIIKWVAELSDFLVGLFGVVKSGGNLTNVIDYILSAFGKFGEMISGFFSNIKNLFTEERLAQFAEFAGELLKKLGDLFVSIGEIILGLFDFAKSALPVIKDLLSFLTTQLGYIGSSLKELFNGNGFGSDLIKVLLGVAAAIAILTAIKWKTDSVKSIMQPIGYILESVADLADSIAQKNYTIAMKNLATAILMIVAGILALASIDKDKLIPATIVMGLVMAAMFGILVYMKNMVTGIQSFGDLTASMKSINQLIRFSSALIILAVALGIAAIPLVALSKQPWQQMLTGILGYSVVVGSLILLSKVVAKSVNFGEIAKMAAALSLLSISLLISTLPLFALSKFNFESLENTAVGLLIILGIVTVSSLIFTVLGKVIKEIAIGAAAFALVSVTLLLMAISFKNIGYALIECVKPYKELGKMSWDEIGKATVGLLSITTMLSILSAVSPLIGIGLISALGLRAFGSALLVFVKPLKELTYIQWDRVTTALKSLLGSITLLSLIGTFLGTLAGIGLSALAGSLILLGTALLVLSNGMVPFVGVLLELENIKFDTILSSIGKLILISIGLSVASAAIAPAAVFLSSVLVMLSPVLLILSGVITAVTALLSILATLFETIGKAAGPDIQNGITSLIQGLEDSLPALTRIINSILEEINKGLKESLKSILEGLWEFIIVNVSGNEAFFGTLLDNLLTLFDKLFPHIAESLFKSFVGTILNTVPNVVDIILDFGERVLNTLRDNITKLGNAIRNLLDEILYQMAYTLISLLPRFIRTVFSGFSDAISDEFNKWRESATGPFRKFLDWLADDVFKINSPSKVMREMGEYVTDGFILGVLEDQHRVYDTAKDLGDKVDEGINDSKIDDAIYSFINLLNGEFDETVVITPILDLTEIQNGKDSLYSMLGSGDYMLTGSGGYLTENLSNLLLKKSDFGDSFGNTSGSSQNTQETIINNTFNVTGDNPEDIANEISKILQLQVDRRNAKWAT